MKPKDTDNKTKSCWNGEYVFNEMGAEKEIKLTTQFQPEQSMEALLHSFIEVECFLRNKRRKKGALG